MTRAQYTNDFFGVETLHIQVSETKQEVINYMYTCVLSHLDESHK